MWEVVKRFLDYEGGSDEVSEPMFYTDAFKLYEKEAKKINAVDKEGKYLHPQVRISLRKREQAQGV